MNDPNKRIDVNLSSLLSLKAELLRKQAEVNRIKKPNSLDPFLALNQKHTSSRIHHKKKQPDTPKTHAEKTDSEKLADEDHEMLAKSKKILEAKAKLYEKMTNNGGAMNSDDTCLVQFNKKKQDDRPLNIPSSSESDSDTDLRGGNISDPDDDQWTEYTDCLGRTRKCLKQDLEFFKTKDRELAQTATSRTTQSEERESSWFVDTKGISSADLPLYDPKPDDDMMSMTSKASKMEEMRIQWENKEMDNLNRDQIHYSDVLFDEARTHGVGYYAFSTDAAEREKQQKMLETDREKTLEEQRKREQVRLTRERIVKERIFGAKNRQRARLGLPPLSRDEFDTNENDGANEKVDDTKKERKQKKREEKELKKKEKLEQEREQKRQQHLRPWDHGKDTVKSKTLSSDDEKQWEYRPEKPEPMSQLQWNEIKRAERNPDFAPPSIDHDDFPLTESFNRFTTIKPKPIKRRNESTYENMYNKPIQNELDGNDFPVEQDDDTNKRRRTEIPPPPTFDYYGPSSSAKPRTKTQNADVISESIEAGLKFLREKSDKIGTGTKQSWVANTTYDE